MCIRDRGEEDITLISQDSLLSAFDEILAVLTLAVAGIAAISLLVAGILTMNVTWIAVSQRSADFGLLKAIGVTAALLALAGAVAGLLLAETLLWLGRLTFDLPAKAPCGRVSPVSPAARTSTQVPRPVTRGITIRTKGG